MYTQPERWAPTGFSQSTWLLMHTRLVVALPRGYALAKQVPPSNLNPASSWRRGFSACRSRQPTRRDHVFRRSYAYACSRSSTSSKNPCSGWPWLLGWLRSSSASSFYGQAAEVAGDTFRVLANVAKSPKVPRGCLLLAPMNPKSERHKVCLRWPEQDHAGLAKIASDREQALGRNDHFVLWCEATFPVDWLMVSAANTLWRARSVC